jgi:membrane fusion protein (multidrug efflux system)
MATQAPDQLFRDEALKARARGTSEGDLLRLSPDWTRWTYWLLVAVFVAGIVYSAVGTLHEYAIGPAVVWVAKRTHVTATVSGTVSSIEVKPGQQVEAGQLLVRFASAIETAELARIDREFEAQLARSLIDPADQSAKAALIELRTQREVAAAKLEQLSVRAPQAGLIGDVRIRPGQLISAGDVVLTLLGQDQRCSVVAMLPAQYRPQLRPGLTMRFEVNGYRYAYQEMTITSVSAQIIGPDELKRYLGQELQDTVKVDGPLVLVEATPPSPTFTVDGQTFEYYHGMNGTAEARVRSESILLSLIPGLRAVIARFRG